MKKEEIKKVIKTIAQYPARKVGTSVQYQFSWRALVDWFFEKSLFVAPYRYIIKNFLSKENVLWLHKQYALLANWYYGDPTKEMIVIGITGTKGKSTTSLILHSVLSALGCTVGLVGGVEIRIGDEVYPNDKHLTMPGRGFVQEQLGRMKKKGCTIAIVETTSEGILQHRHAGILYDILIFTNLSQEHLITHKTFENYKHTKGILFKELAVRAADSKFNKIVQNKEVKKIAYLNADDNHAPYFSSCVQGKVPKIEYGLGERSLMRATNVVENKETVSFVFDKHTYTLGLVGAFQVYNALPAILIAKRLEVFNYYYINETLKNIHIPGRMEKIEEGQGYEVFVDYAHEPLSVGSVLSAGKKLLTKKGARLIAIIGAVGGGRYIYNAEDIGAAAKLHADTIIVTDIDPYFDDPKEIAKHVIEGIGIPKKEQQVHLELDRRKAFAYAFSIARDGDVVIITGKGAEYTTMIQGKAIQFDERKIVREMIHASFSKKSS
ncbi:MAG: UDP-N-acetylmuramyl-tripeptide synthetase [Alphaproteobacteria bacterium]|nr:UDP-N-acetylmuramyl-tripeptide synthetase [Alphaproteobacteria bacterium]